MKKYDLKNCIKLSLSPRAIAFRLTERLGYPVTNLKRAYPDDRLLVKSVKSYTMVTSLTLHSICDAVDHVCCRGVKGDWVECGVWRGGASLLAALKFKQQHCFCRLWLYDIDNWGAEKLITSRTGLPVNYILGDVNDTLKTWRPESISILRLDTNSYDSTLAELEALYPLLSSNGILLMDDWCLPDFRRAVRDYFGRRLPFVARLGFAAAVIVKP